jgi:hypothetical protein
MAKPLIVWLLMLSPESHPDLNAHVMGTEAFSSRAACVQRRDELKAQPYGGSSVYLYCTPMTVVSEP